MSCQRSEILEKEHVQAENCLEQWFSNLSSGILLYILSSLKSQEIKDLFLLKLGRSTGNSTSKPPLLAPEL